VQEISTMDDIIDRLARALAPRIAAELRGVSCWIDQTNTPLGRNTHCAAVRRRIDAARASSHQPDAAITPKGLYLLSPDALREELRRARPSNDVRKAEPDEPPPSSHSLRLAEKLRRLK
jgi:hypothetical protein